MQLATCALLALVLTLVNTRPARAGTIWLSVYIGVARTTPSDIHLSQPNAETDVTFHHVRWADRSFRPSIYYGIRLSYAPSQGGGAVLNLDYTHYKIYAQTDRAVDVAGTWRGNPIGEEAPLSRYVQGFDITHGLNMIAFDVLCCGRAYAGGGVAYYVAHAENRIGGEANREHYAGAGLGYQLVGGYRDAVSGDPLFAELKYSSGDVTVDTAEQGRAQTRAHTWHVLFGSSGD